MKKRLLAAMTTALLFGSCIGPNNAFNSVHDWNENVSENKWGQEAVHIAFHIIPVYGLAYLGDILIFNSIEFWGGDNPIDEPDGM